MLAEMDAGQIAEWKAFDTLQEEAHQRTTLANQARAGVKTHKRGRR